MANLLVLHPGAKDAFGQVGGVKALSRALAGKDSQNVFMPEEVGFNGPDRVFLLARLAFLSTMERREAVRGMVELDDVVGSLIYVSTMHTSVR
jgi:hypothetical protein